jgi:flagellar hook-associated protein 3 FlgL
VTLIRNGLYQQSQAMLLQLSGIRRRMDVVEQQAITGQKLMRPSDIPEAIGEAQNLRAAIADQAVFKTNASSAMSMLDVADQALGSAADLLSRAREIAVAMASDTYDASSRSLSATEVDQILQQLVQVGNTRSGDRYLFAGTAFKTPAFAADGSYLGSADSASVKVGPGSWTETGVPGSTVFGQPTSAFQAVKALSDALRSGDATAIRDAIDPLVATFDAVVSARGEVGNSFNHAEEASQLAEGLEVSFTTRMNHLVATDPYEVYSELGNLRSVYDAAMKVAGSASKLKLFDVL